MIFVTLGTNEARFERLADAVDLIPPGEDVLLQTGHSLGRPARATCIEFLPFDEMVDLVERARVVVSHAGVGSIMVALMAGRRPVVVPRRADLREAVDDHQLPLSRRLAAAGLVLLVEDVADLPAAVAGDGAREPLRPGEGTELARELRGFLAEALPAPRRAYRAG